MCRVLSVIVPVVLAASAAASTRPVSARRTPAYRVHRLVDGRLVESSTYVRIERAKEGVFYTLYTPGRDRRPATGSRSRPTLRAARYFSLGPRSEQGSLPEDSVALVEVTRGAGDREIRWSGCRLVGEVMLPGVSPRKGEARRVLLAKPARGASEMTLWVGSQRIKIKIERRFRPEYQIAVPPQYGRGGCGGSAAVGGI